MPNPRRHPHDVVETAPQLTEAQRDAIDRLDMLRSKLDDVVEELTAFHPGDPNVGHWAGEARTCLRYLIEYSRMIVRGDVWARA